MVRYLVGIDEVGRGPLAGPVTVCAVSFSKLSNKGNRFVREFKDSKKLSEAKRLELFNKAKIAKKECLINYSVSSVSSTYIDKYGISKAVNKAIKNCLKKLNLEPQECKVMLDGLLKAPIEYKFQKTIIKGDDKIKVISCASVIAKVSRDSLMKRLHKKYENYGFSDHKGYGTKNHILKIKKFGPSEIHRRSFLTRI